MQEIVGGRIHPELRELVLEATLALARLDADRLEELALSCQALNRDLALIDYEDRASLNRQARNASPEMAVFERVLDATRDNLRVINRVRERQESRLEYSAPHDRIGCVGKVGEEKWAQLVRLSISSPVLSMPTRPR